MKKSLQRMVDDGLLKQAAKGVSLTPQPVAGPAGSSRDRQGSPAWQALLRGFGERAVGIRSHLADMGLWERR